MIDIESAVFASVAEPLREKYPGIYVAGEATDLPAQFPAVTILEASNTVYRPARTTKIEVAATVMFEVNVYSNMIAYKKMEAKTIMADIDLYFEKLGFTRIMCNPITNLQDSKIYRILARYEAVVDEDFWIYQN